MFILGERKKKTKFYIKFGWMWLPSSNTLSLLLDDRILLNNWNDQTNKVYHLFSQQLTSRLTHMWRIFIIFLGLSYSTKRKPNQNVEKLNKK
jgi:hypothetical protein